MPVNETQFLDTNGLNELWTKLRKELPFHENHGNGTSDGWAKLLSIQCTPSMDNPLVLNILSQGDTPSVAEISFVSQEASNPAVSYFMHVVPESSTGSNIGYTYSDGDSVRTYTFWKKRNGKDNSISVHVDCVPEYIPLITFPADHTQSDTEPTGIVYASKVYDTVSAQTAYSSKGTATKVPQITTNTLGQVTGITEVTISGVTPASHTHGSITNDGKIGSTADLAVVTGTSGAVTTADLSTSDPTASESTLTAIATISQDSKGKITATKKTIQDGTTSQKGVVQLENSHTSTSTTKAATPNSVKEAYDLAAGKQDPITFDGTYDASTNKAATVATVTNAINALDGNLNDTTPGAGKTLTGFSQTNGVVSATFGDISITKSQVSDFSHAHGSITNDGKITDTGVAIGNNDTLVIADSSASGAVKQTSIKFDGSTGTKALTQKGTWESFKPTQTAVSDPTASGTGTQFISNISQDENGVITVYKKTVQDGTTSQKGVVQLEDSHTSTSTTTAATPNSVKEAYDLASGKQDTLSFDGDYNATSNKVATVSTVTSSVNALDAEKTSTDGTNVQVKVTQTDGKITAVNVTTDNTENKSNKVTAWSSTTADAHYPSEKLVKAGLDAKGTLVTAWQTTPDDTHYPSEKLVKDTLDNLPPGTSVKGDAESSYRTGQVNLTPANLGISATATSVTVGSTTFNQYVHPTTNGNKHVPADGASGNFLKYSSAGTAQWSNLSADDIPNISADKITSGTLPVSRGGTGATTEAAARTNLDVYSKSETEALLNGKIVIVTTLPETGEAGVTYYLKDTTSTAVDKYDEYIWATDAGATTESWIHVGEKSVDLSDYVNTLSSTGTGSVITGISKSGNTLTATTGNIAIGNLSDWASSTDVTVSSVTYHTYWPTAPTSSNTVYGISIKDGKLYQVKAVNNSTFSVVAYDKDTTYTEAALGQGYGTCSTAEATAAKTVTMSGYELAVGGIVTVKFTNGLCASSTLSVNGNTAKPVYISGSAATASTAKAVQAGDTATFMYDGTAYHLIGTDRAAQNPIVNISRSGTTFTATRLDGSTFTFTQQDNNTTYTNESLGNGYGTCTTGASTAAKEVALSGYDLVVNGVVAVKFTEALCASATMSINGKTAKPIYIRGTAVTADSAKEVLAGDIAFFVYDGTAYQFICEAKASAS